MAYLDNNATTQPAPEVFEAMAPFLKENFGNPSSSHATGRAARNAIEDARAAVAELLGASEPSEIVFTSGGTESDNWALIAAAAMNQGRSGIVTTAVEHEAVRNACDYLEQKGCRVTTVGVDGLGRLDKDSLRQALTKETAVVSVMMANNETGVVFPVAEIAQIVHEHSDALVHVDGVAGAGKLPILLRETEIDLFSVSGHKFHGPKGVGALYIRSGVDLPPRTFGGRQESGRRAGTEAVHQIAGIGAAARLVQDIGAMDRVAKLRDRLESEVLRLVPGSSVNGDRSDAARIPNTSNISFSLVNGEMLLSRLDDEGVSVSTGSACNAESREVSAVLKAMDLPFERAAASIRFSLGRYNTAEEIDRVLGLLPGIVEELRSISV